MKLCAGSLNIKTSTFQVDDSGASPTPALQKSPLVSQVSLAHSNSLLKSYHYLGPVRTASCCFGHDEGVTVWGVMRSRIWAQRLKAAGFRPLELIRMVGKENHTWATSSLLSHSVRQLFKLGLADCLVTYADRKAGHSGKVYLAANWQRAQQDSQPDGFVWRLDGKIVSRKRFYAELGTSSIDAVKVAYGDRISLEPDVPKLRFFYLQESTRLAEFQAATTKVKTWGLRRTTEHERRGT